jgi:hypothetical protein
MRYTDDMADDTPVEKSVEQLVRESRLLRERSEQLEALAEAIAQHGH